MSASYYACSSNTPNLTLYFLDSSSRLRQLHTANPDDSDWTTGPLDSITNVPDATHLASYSCQHPSYPDYSDIWYQDSNGYYQIIDAFGRKKTKVDSTLSSSRDVTVLKPPQNSSLAFVPHYIYDYNQSTKDPWLSVFFVNDDVLWEYHYKNNQMTFSKHFDKPNDPSLPPSTNIAGFSWGYNQDLPNVGGMQVLYTMPDDDTGGISMCKLNKISDEGTWQYTNSKFMNNPFKGVARYSSVAATEAGRVYAVVDDAGKVELREWEYVQDEDTYRSLGTVNTNVSQG
ncbi:hypothetical protein DIS24_g10066 [Lasiodiplodia hormozganensis]|uniref:Fucose-specific lectin n=1 Tax=Lasiodiplodia hormozganensis TaxID=869390 RepID=A0AA39XQ64_9PEZI|nr:hypothetical protein DIS24_g10066 [Lasiodiplodia hormozganensis]